VVAGQGFVQHPGLVVYEGGLFISGPAVVKIIEDNRPIARCFGFTLMRIWVLFPQSQMAEDALYHGGFVNQTYDLHVMAAAGTSQGIHLPDLFDQLSPGS